MLLDGIDGMWRHGDEIIAIQKARAAANRRAGDVAHGMG
jgi:hypothetical protein